MICIKKKISEMKRKVEERENKAEKDQKTHSKILLNTQASLSRGPVDIKNTKKQRHSLDEECDKVDPIKQVALKTHKIKKTRGIKKKTNSSQVEDRNRNLSRKRRKIQQISKD